MTTNRSFQFLVIGILCLMTACQAARQPLNTAMLKSGDAVDGMRLRTGAAEAPPLWAFCSRTLEGEGSYMLDCRTPVLASLGIGNIFSSTDKGLTDSDWSGLVWELSIDGKAVDLESFGTFDYGVPSMIKSPSPVRMAFKSGTAWDIVLTNLNPGHHTFWFVAQSNNKSYTWFMTLDIAPTDKLNISAVPFPLRS